MSDVEDPRTGDPDDRHPLGVLRGAIARGDVLELHGSEGSATIRIPDDHQDQLADVIHDLEPDDHLRADGGDFRDDGDIERRPCDNCGGRLPRSQMTEIDVTPEDDYYPTFIYVCPSCWGESE